MIVQKGHRSIYAKLSGYSCGQFLFHVLVTRTPRPNYYIFIGYLEKKEVKSAKRTHTFKYMSPLSKNPPSRHITSNQRRIDVGATSWRRIDVDMTLFSGRVPAGPAPGWYTAIVHLNCFKYNKVEIHQYIKFTHM